MTHSVYIMRCAEACKIGYSKHPRKRLSDIQSCCPFQVTIAAVFPLKNETAARDVERACHNQFDWGRMNGEWFQVPYKQIKEFMYQIIKDGEPYPCGPIYTLGTRRAPRFLYREVQQRQNNVLPIIPG